MNSDDANKISREFESTLSAIIPEIAQVIQQYQVSGAFKTKLKILPEREEISGIGGCKKVNGIDICSVCSEYPNTIEIFPEMLTSEPDPKCAEQFGTAISSTLCSTVDLLGQSIQNVGQSFEVHFFIETEALNSEQPVICQWGSDICQVNILQCSKS